MPLSRFLGLIFCSTFRTRLGRAFRRISDVAWPVPKWTNWNLCDHFLDRFLHHFLSRFLIHFLIHFPICFISNTFGIAFRFAFRITFWCSLSGGSLSPSLALGLVHCFGREHTVAHAELRKLRKFPIRISLRTLARRWSRGWKRGDN